MTETGYSSYDHIFDDYLAYTSDIPDESEPLEPVNHKASDIAKDINTTSDIMLQQVNVEDISIPTRSPARLLAKKPGQFATPNSPDVSISDASSVEYNSYGSDRSSQASIFSDISDRDRFDDAVNNHNSVNSNIDKIPESPIDLDDSDYEEILELLDYIEADEDKMVQQVDAVATVVGPEHHHSVKMVTVTKV